jgi:hypothetical protein
MAPFAVQRFSLKHILGTSDQDDKRPIVADNTAVPGAGSNTPPTASPKKNNDKSPGNEGNADAFSADASTLKTHIAPIDWAIKGNTLVNDTLGKIPYYPHKFKLNKIPHDPPKVGVGFKSNDVFDPDNNFGKATLKIPLLNANVSNKSENFHFHTGLDSFAQHDFGVPRYFRPEGYRNGPTRQNSSAGLRFKVDIDGKKGPISGHIQGRLNAAPNRFEVPAFIFTDTLAFLPPDPNTCDDQGICTGPPRKVPIGTQDSTIVKVVEPVPDTPIHNGKDLSATGTVELAADISHLALNIPVKSERSFASVGLKKVTVTAQVATGTLFHGKYVEVAGPGVSLFNGGLTVGPVWAASVSRLSYTGQGVPPKGWRVASKIDLGVVAKSFGGLFKKKSPQVKN